MQFTPQQVVGGPAYGSTVTKIGNYNEDLTLQEERFKEYQQLKAQGRLTSQIIHKKFQHHDLPQEKTPDSEKNLKFGGKYLIFNEEFKAFLSADLEKMHHVNNRFPVTLAQSKGPVHRNVFVLEPVERRKGQPMEFYPESEKGLLHFGQAVRIRCLKSFYESEDGPLYLRSERVSHTCSARLTTNAQEVSLDDEVDYSTVWRVVGRNPNERFEFEGQVVPARIPVCLVHSQTGEFLGGSGKFISNDFGKEGEVCAKKFLNIHKVEKDQNVWYFV